MEGMQLHMGDRTVPGRSIDSASSCTRSGRKYKKDKDKSNPQPVEGTEAEMENPQVRQSVEALRKDDVDLIFNV